MTKNTPQYHKKRFHEKSNFFLFLALYNCRVVEATIRIITQIGGKSLRCGPEASTTNKSNFCIIHFLDLFFVLEIDFSFKG